MILRHIRSGFKTLGARIFNKRYPVKVNYICTYACNANCSYCNTRKRKKKKEMSTSKVKSMLISLKKMGAEQITFIGGEPTVKKDMDKIVQYAKSLGFLTTMSTNGIILKDIEGLDMIITCLNGPEKIHDKIRGKGSYKKVMKLLKSANSGKLITMIITKENYGQVDYILEISKKLNISVNFQPAFKNELAKVEKGIEKQLLSKSQIKRVFKYLFQKKKQGFLISNSYSSLKDFAEKGKSKPKKCYHGKLTVTIDPYGNMFRCYKYINSKPEINGIRDGWKAGFDKIKLKKCNECYYGCHIEDNHLFSLEPSSIYNLIKLNRILTKGSH